MVTVPVVGQAVPTVSAATPSSVPTWRLVVGGDFIGWTPNSSAAFYSIGRSFFVHDLALASEVDAANRATAEAEAERAAAPTPAPSPASQPSQTISAISVTHS